MYIVCYNDNGKVTVVVTNDILNFGMGINQEIVDKVNKCGHFEEGKLVVFKEGTWDEI